MTALSSYPEIPNTAQILRRFTFSEWGGTETVVWNSSQALKRLGIGAEILCTDALAHGHFEETRDELTIRRFPYFYPYFPLTAKKNLELDKKGGNPISLPLRNYLMNNDFSVYHVHAPGRIAQIVREVARRKRKPYIISFHGGCCDVPKQEMSDMLSPLRHTFPYGGILDRLCGWRADTVADAAGIICVGANELSELKKRWPDQNIIYLPNGIDAAVYREKVPFDLRERLHIPHRRAIMLCVSRIDPQKNQRMLVKTAVEAVRQGQDIHLLLIGPVTVPDYAVELEKDVIDNGLTGRFTLLPGLPPGDAMLRAAYQQSSALLLASRHEPFGIVALEAWSAGLPVIASAVGGLKYLIDDQVNGLSCPPDDAAAFLHAWNSLRRNPMLRMSLIAGATKAVEPYSWDRIAKRLADFYEEAVKKT